MFCFCSQVVDIRELVLADLIATFGLRSAPFNDWRDVLDLAVYKGQTGLRMMGSRKVRDRLSETEDLGSTS